MKARENERDYKIEIQLGQGRNHYGKRRKCWLPAFSPFSKMFSTRPKQISVFESHLLIVCQTVELPLKKMEDFAGEGVLKCCTVTCKNMHPLSHVENVFVNVFNLLPHMSILGFPNSAANKDMMAKMWTNRDTII